jgi:hypothetical protein
MLPRLFIPVAFPASQSGDLGRNSAHVASGNPFDLAPIATCVGDGANSHVAPRPSVGASLALYRDANEARSGDRRLLGVRTYIPREIAWWAEMCQKGDDC